MEELNRKWKIFLDQEYQKEAHSGIREYYESYGVKVPAAGISPEQEWMRDERGLVFIDVSVVAEAFQHREVRRIDEAGCFSFGGSRYEASAALSNQQVEIAYDPMNTETVMVYSKGTEAVRAHRMEIGSYASKVPPVPSGMTGKEPESSRLLDALEKKYRQNTPRWQRRCHLRDTERGAGKCMRYFLRWRIHRLPGTCRWRGCTHRRRSRMRWGGLSMQRTGRCLQW